MNHSIHPRGNELQSQRQVKVLHVLNELQRSGAEVNLLQSTAEWRRYDFKLDILATGSEVGPLAGAFREAGYGVYHLPLRSKRRFVPSHGFCSDFVDLCRRNQYDIVHIHTEKAHFLLATLCKFAGVKTIARSVHSAFLFYGWMRTRKQLERAYSRSLDVRFGFISPSVRAAEIQRFKNSGVLIQNWFDVDHFRPPTTQERSSARQSLSLPENSFVIISVGNCNQIKNHTIIIHALNLLQPNPDIAYLHVGKEDLHRTEKQLIDELGLSQQVFLAGQVNDPRPYLWAADVFIMPSLMEGLGIAALEAAGTALPLILSNVDGLRDIATEVKGSCLITPTPENLSSAIRTIYNSNRHLTNKCALEDSQRVRSHFSPRTGVRSLISDLYQIAV